MTANVTGSGETTRRMAAVCAQVPVETHFRGSGKTASKMAAVWPLRQAYETETSVRFEKLEQRGQVNLNPSTTLTSDQILDVQRSLKASLSQINGCSSARVENS